MLLRTNNSSGWKLSRLCLLVFAVVCAYPGWAQSDADDLLMMVPMIAAKSQQKNESGGQSIPAPIVQPEEPEQTDSLTTLERNLLDAHNFARASSRRCGGVFRSAVSALNWNSRLAQAARNHSSDMNRTGVFDHTGSDGSSASQRVTRTGYVWGAVAENIAGGYPNVESVVNALLASAGHCNNIMGSGYIDFGAAKVGRYWTMVFARPRSNR
ncbi:MAG: CAP domain-containing protein [Acidiferrobacterales bacterium]|nr:CAP domain-containing protein [Acidiferrobacterales bacterium]